MTIRQPKTGTTSVLSEIAQWQTPQTTEAIEPLNTVPKVLE
jgi:hypothetical protein